MANQKSISLKHWLRILQRWPVDKIRPNSISFQKIMQNQLNKRISNSSSLSSAAVDLQAMDALISVVPPPVWDESKEMQQANALYSLLENRYSQAHPFPQKLRYPKSDPEYYDKLVEELQEAPSRSWLGRLVKRVKGSLRFS